MSVELKREKILAALALVLGLPRNVAVGEIEGGVHRALHDGGAELTEEFINPPTYEWTIRPSVLIVREWTGTTSPDAELAAEIEALANLLEAVDDGLGGLVTDIRIQAPDFAPRSLWGASDMKGAEVTIELDYWSASSLG